MAESQGELINEPVTGANTDDLTETHPTSHHIIDTEHELLTRPGAQISDKQIFTNKDGRKITGYAIILDFGRLLKLSMLSWSHPEHNLPEIEVIAGIPNRDLIHAVVGLYDVSLSEMTPDVLYSTVCATWARTIILVRDLDDIINELEERKKCAPKDKIAKEDTVEDDEGCTENLRENEIDANEDVYEEDESEPSKFAEVFSDTESEEEDDEDENDNSEEDFSRGINSFIERALERRKKRTSCEGPITESMVGIENRIIGCATFEKKFVKHKDRVIHLTLVSVRKRCRSYGFGRFLLSRIVDPKVVGNYDAVVVHADNEALEFFQKFGFSDDVVLNSRWNELAEQFTNCTLMCYLPGFSGHRLLSSIKIPGLEMYELEQEFLKWKDKTLEVYQQQITCMMRMKQEVLQLKYTTAAQEKIMKALVEENEGLKTDKVMAEKDLLNYKLAKVKTTFEHDNAIQDGDDIATQELIADLQWQVNKMDLQLKHKRSSSRELKDVLANNSSGSFTVIDESRYLAFAQVQGQGDEEPYDHIKDSAFFYDVTEQFKQHMMLDSIACRKCEVSTISKALIPDKIKKVYIEKIKGLKDPLMVMELYFCGTLEHPERIKEILKVGFSDRDFSCGEYGKGLYFSKFPSKAAQFSTLGSLLKAEVGIGHAETVVKMDRTRISSSPGYDSIITPGRLTHMLGQSDSAMNQEYVVFDPTQVLPLCLLTYETS